MLCYKTSDYQNSLANYSIKGLNVCLYQIFSLISLISKMFGIPLKHYKLSSSISNYFTIDFVNWIINVKKKTVTIPVPLCLKIS